jgi:hypothetical protein
MQRLVAAVLRIDFRPLGRFTPGLSAARNLDGLVLISVQLAFGWDGAQLSRREAQDLVAVLFEEIGEGACRVGISGLGVAPVGDTDVLWRREHRGWFLAGYG